MTSSTAINTHVVRNSATAPVATRRLIMRVRIARACLIDPPSRRPGAGGGDELGVIVFPPVAHCSRVAVGSRPPVANVCGMDKKPV